MNISPNNMNDITPEDIFLDGEKNTALYVYGKTNRSLLWGFGIIVLGLVGVMWMKTLELQVMASPENLPFDSFQSGYTYVKPNRGNIYDRYGKLLAYNTASFDVILDKESLPKYPPEQEQVIQKASAFFEVSIENIQKNIQQSSKSYTTIKEDIPKDKAILYKVEHAQLPGFRVEEHQKRTYVDPNYFAHIIGYTGKLSPEDLQKNPRYLPNDQIGKTGLERQYEDLLKGEYGLRSVNSPANSLIRAPQDGESLTLTIDSELQRVMHDAMQKTLDQKQLSRAVGIALNPQNGEILAMTSLPSFDNNQFISGITQDQYQSLINNSDNPLLNRAIAGEFAPASTVKPVMAAALLEEDIISPETTVNDPSGRLIIPNPYDPSQPYVYPDWKVHGISDVKKAIASSVNVFFYTFGGGVPGGHTGLGIERIASYYRLFGYGTLTGIDLPGERSGLVADPTWKRQALNQPWVLGDTYHVSIGQGGMLATPLQVINAISAIANGGTLYTPHLYKTDQNIRIIRDNMLDSQTIYHVQQGMRQTVLDGTAYQLQDLPFSSAAKTGTAQTGAAKNNSWFTAYAPFENPQIAVVVLVEQGNEGYLTSIPVAKEVLHWYHQNRGFNQ